MSAPSVHRPLSRLLPACLAVVLSLPTDAPAADVPPALAGSGVASVPADAAFLSATLRVREQYDRFVQSNAYAALRGVPAVKRALDSLEEQRMMPGNPLSLADSFLQLPENAQAVEVLADMVATDTFVYGEPSCASFVQLVRKLSAIAQAVGAIGDGDMIIEEEMEVFEEDAGGEAAARRAARLMLCQLDLDERSPEVVQKRMVVQTLVDNIDLVVMPDVVWGFKTTKAAAATAQIARIETLARNALEGNPDLAGGIERRKLAGGDFLVFTVRGESLPWGDLQRELEEDTGDIDGFDAVFARLRKLDLCVALGLVGDRVILSFGDSTDHLLKLAGGDGKTLLGLPAFEPLRAHADKRLTAVSYLSAAMVKAMSQSPDDMRQQFDAIDESLDDSGLPEEAIDEGRKLVEQLVAALAKRMPEPGPWTAFSFMGDSGYEGYVWDWSRNQPLDGTRRLDLLEHAGGAPLAVVASRLKSDPKLADDMSAFVGGLWSVFVDHALPALDGEAQDRAEEFAEHMGPIARRLADALRGKLLPALADGQVGLVLDGKSRTKKPQTDLPASADPLPLPEAAIVLPLGDAKLFREGLSDLFTLADDAVAAVREIDPDAVPPGYEVPDPEKAKVEAGTVWSFALPASGLDEQLRPAIGVGDDVAVFALAPKQAARLLGAAKLETGSQLSSFEEPLAGAAALDVAGIVDALEPWVVYLTRYGCVREREGSVAADTELDAGDETEQAKEALKSVDVVLEVVKCLRAAVAETSSRDGALVTHWRNIIRDLPKK
jgi:hypothetical protein